MKDFLLKIVRNPGVRKAFLALVVAVAAACGLVSATGCASFGSFKPSALTAADKARGAIECRVAVLDPYLGDQAEQWVLEIAAGRVDPVRMLRNLNLSVDDIVKIAEVFNACAGESAPVAPAPAVEPASVHL